MVTEGRKIGDIGERFAAEYLETKGYKVLGKNFSKPYGEIDIIAKKNREIIFVEVKTSKYYKNSDFKPEFRVDKRKIEALGKVCQIYLIENKFQSKQNWQADVISVLLNPDLSLNGIEHFENIYFG